MAKLTKADVARHLTISRQTLYEWIQKGRSSVGSDGFIDSSLERGRAAMFNACEWGNYCRVEQSATESRQLGRRAIVTYGAIVVAPWSDVYTPQQLARKAVGVPYYAGTHYLALLLLEAPYHGTEVATPEVGAETYGAFNRAVREAVRRINADKRKYLQYFIDYHHADPEVARLTVDDLRPSRLVVVEPVPIPEEELRRTYDWRKSWGLLGDVDWQELIDAERQSAAHAG